MITGRAGVVMVLVCPGSVRLSRSMLRGLSLRKAWFYAFSFASRAAKAMLYEAR